MTAAMNPRVASGITGLFGKPERADCTLVFVLEPQPRSDEGTSARKTKGGCALQQCGEPLPAHSLVLDFASDKIKAQVRWLAAGTFERAVCGRLCFWVTANASAISVHRCAEAGCGLGPYPKGCDHAVCRYPKQGYK